MTNYPFSPIGKQADILLTTAVFGENMIGESMAKRIPSFCLMESLYINALTHIDSGQRAQLKQRNQALTVNK